MFVQAPSQCRDYATMWNGMRQRQESQTSVWRTHLAHFNITICCTRFEANGSMAHILTDADLCKRLRKHIIVTYESTIRCICTANTPNLTANANNNQLSKATSLTIRTMASLSRLYFTQTVPKVDRTKITQYVKYQMRTIVVVLFREF